jgi:formylglycine-generating enzyme required for sulfatase activity
MQEVCKRGVASRPHRCDNPRMSLAGLSIYKWRINDGEHELRFVAVPGTAGRPYLFGAEPDRRPIEVRDFWLMATHVTQALWSHVMGSNPAERDQPRKPVTNVSWHHIADSGGFLDRINASEVLPAVAGSDRRLRFRLPSETEWEYAARGGPYWTDNFRFSGGNDIDKVAWYGHRFTAARRLVCRTLGWRRGWRVAGRRPRGKVTHTHEVAAKAPNQLGLYDMSGNVWEWCADTCVDDLDQVPRDGTPNTGPGEDHPPRRLSSQLGHPLHRVVAVRHRR